jgi:GT2 family glycosyltransferase
MNQFFLIFDPTKRSSSDFLIADAIGRTSSVNIERVATAYGNQIFNSNFSDHSSIPWGQYHGGTFAPVDINFSVDFSVEDINIAYLYIGPDTLDAIVLHSAGKGFETYFFVESGRQYAFSGYFATHRCSASLVLIFFDAENNYITHEVADIEPDIPGGDRIELYKRVGIVSLAPTGARLACIRLVARKIIEGHDAFLFFSRLWFGRCIGSQFPEWSLSPFDMFGAFSRDQCNSLVSLLVNVPTCYLDGGQHTIKVVDKITGQVVSGSEITVQHELQASGEITGINGNNVIGNITLLNDISNDLELELLVDGEVIEFGVASGAYPSKTFNIALPSHLLDGQPHVFSVALKATGQIVARYPTILSLWHDNLDAVLMRNAVQVFDFPSALKTSRLQRLLDHLDHNETLSGASSSKKLFDNLLAGPIKRSTYDPVVFPVSSSPDVSIILPSSGAFELIYFALNSLALAVNHATVEVIIVDYSSSEVTKSTNDVTAGIRIIRPSDQIDVVQACNIAASAANGWYLVFVETCNEVTSNWLDELIFIYQNFQSVGLVGSKKLDSNGHLYNSAGIVSSAGIRHTAIQSENSFSPDVSYVRQFDCFFQLPIMVRRSTWNALGGFSSSFTSLPLALADFSLTIRTNELKVLFASQSIVFHHRSHLDISVETGQTTRDELSIFNTKWIRTFHDIAPIQPGSRLAQAKSVSLHALVVDINTPTDTLDHNNYATVQEMRLLQLLGFEVKFVTANLEYKSKTTTRFQRMGIEVLYSPFISSFENVLRQTRCEFDLILVRRSSLICQTLPTIRKYQPRAKVIVNVTDFQYVHKERLLGDSAARATLSEDESRMLSAADINVSYYGGKNEPSTFIHEFEIKQFPIVSEFRLEPTDFDKRQNVGILCICNKQSEIIAIRNFIESVWPLLEVALGHAKLCIFAPSTLASHFALYSVDKVTTYSLNHDVEQVIHTIRLMILPSWSQASIKLVMCQLFAAGVPIIMTSGVGLSDTLPSQQDTQNLVWPADLVDNIIDRYGKKEMWTNFSGGLEECAGHYHNIEHGADMVSSFLNSIGLVCRRDRKNLHFVDARYQNNYGQ